MKDTSDIKKSVEEHFGTLNSNQLWTIVKIAKHVRLRARNNSAFNNFMNSIIPNATFKTVTKTRKSWKTGLEESYPGLSIVVDGVENSGEDDEE